VENEGHERKRLSCLSHPSKLVIELYHARVILSIAGVNVAGKEYRRTVVFHILAPFVYAMRPINDRTLKLRYLTLTEYRNDRFQRGILVALGSDFAL
jgi:hypothetical protein